MLVQAGWQHTLPRHEKSRTMADKRTHITRSISAPVETVWALLADADTWTQWNPTIIKLVGPIAVGNKVELVSTVNPKRTFKLRVDELSAPRRMVWSDGMPLGLFTGTRTYTIEPAGDGCVFTMTEEYSGPLSGLISKSIPDMNPSFVEFADGLKAAAEAAR